MSDQTNFLNQLYGPPVDVQRAAAQQQAQQSFGLAGLAAQQRQAASLAQADQQALAALGGGLAVGSLEFLYGPPIAPQWTNSYVVQQKEKTYWMPWVRFKYRIGLWLIKFGNG